jgi:uncharacterized protein (TIGR03067 family)
MRTTMLAVMLSALAAGPKDDKTVKDLARMQGDWACDSFVREGLRFPDEDAQALFRTVKGNDYTVSRFNKAVGKGAFTLDAKKSPPTIDITPAGPAGKGGPLLGIYKFEGDKFTMCYAPPGQPRPKAFSAREKSGHTLTVWVREKK